LAQLWPEEDVAVAMSAEQSIGFAGGATHARQLSGGQQQRVAIARRWSRARHHSADEPIASLDPQHPDRDGWLLRYQTSTSASPVICNLHSLDLARSYCDR